MGGFSLFESKTIDILHYLGRSAQSRHGLEYAGDTHSMHRHNETLQIFQLILLLTELKSEFSCNQHLPHIRN